MLLRNCIALAFLIYCATLLKNVSSVEPIDDFHREPQRGPQGCGPKIECVPKVSCPALLRPDATTPSCTLSNGRPGFCCTTGQNHTTEGDLKARSSLSFDEKSLKDAKASSELKLKKLMDQQKDIIANQSNKEAVLARGQPSFGHFQSQRNVENGKAFAVSQIALKNLFATEALKEREGLTNEQMALGLGRVAMDDAPCPEQPKCDSHPKYRSIDGACNNDDHPTWGAARTATERLLPPNYGDGVWSPRVSSVDKRLKLASPRHISDHMLPDKHRPHGYATLMMMQFGQFIAHDVSASVTLTYPNGTGASCCTADGSAALPAESRHFGCFPIDIHEEDKFYGQFGLKCMNFVRTQLAPSHDCTLGYARQMNGVTHFLDLSHVYGSDPDTLNTLREWKGGRMRMLNDFGRELLPLTDDKNDCITMEQGSACFKSGDGQANQAISLLVVHMIFTREHNRVAHALSQLNPHWHDEDIFFEARRIVVAEFQHIVYSEYLPIVIGHKAMDEFKLWPQPHGEYSKDYDPKVNPSLVNEFSVAAFRFGHSNVDGRLKIPTQHGIDEVILIPEVMFHPARMRLKQFYDRILNGMTTQPMQETDPSVSKQLTRYLFRGGNPFGLDLASLNIQRGRDHGLRGYNDYRQLVGLPRVKSMHDFGEKVAEHMMGVYAHADDIDLWVGGLLEAPEHGALVGFTFREIIAEQFSRFRRGDKYFYEHHPSTNPGAFKPDQLAEIKKVTLSRLICDNSDHIELHSQSFKAFLRHDLKGNEPIHCGDPAIPFVDLGAWKDNKF